jgi:hypothetical protein
MCLQSSTNRGLPDLLNATVGSLKNRLTEWRLITDNQYILDIVENGYKIPFKTEREQIYINNNKSSLVKY